ncbi:hypothetical protein [Xenophilus sp. Marseille-Q4582]|uniref:hypothetical protein n=1 Tax=Xenophilus sp. Marseille-Q4582 TaxID=2866600 RepID=UPI001CE3C960|nr:hypothetical protein [Xenophilus sp. Marseille-Q4582]
MDEQMTKIGGGDVREVAQSIELHSNSVRLDRGADLPDLVIQGLTDDEARKFAEWFGSPVSLYFGSRA